MQIAAASGAAERSRAPARQPALRARAEWPTERLDKLRRLFDAGFVVTVNPDDRAITTTTTSRELALWAEHHDFTDTELAAVQQAAVAAAFCDDPTRAAVAAKVTAGWP